jgi:hypothetical protein
MGLCYSARRQVIRAADDVSSRYAGPSVEQDPSAHIQPQYAKPSSPQMNNRHKPECDY